jgi:hypothetical protein
MGAYISEEASASELQRRIASLELLASESKGVAEGVPVIQELIDDLTAQLAERSRLELESRARAVHRGDA